jgi:PAS domain S-box-containing protein
MEQKMVVNGSDLENEKRKQVRLLRNLYRSFVDNSFEIIFRSSLEDKVLFTNRLFIQSFGFKNNRSAKGTSVRDLFIDPDDYRQLKLKLINGKSVQQRVVNFKKLNGNKMVTLANIQSNLNENDERIFNWTVLDISERVEFENNLEQKNLQLAKINNQMEKFLYSTSHDLRSPITSILGLVNLARMHSIDQTIIDYVGKIEASAQKLEKIIRDTISFSKTTYQNIHSEKVDFETIIWKIINTHHNDDNFNRLKVEVTIRGEAPFYSDPDRLEIILDNLVRNAIQFLDVTKVRPFLHVLVTLVPAHVTIEIHDNGIGIARQYFDQIFKMFYKASVHSKGAGLGLYIAKEGVEQLAGNISVESEVGFGSVFKVFIPNSPKGKLINRKNQLRHDS